MSAFGRPGEARVRARGRLTDVELDAVLAVLAERTALVRERVGVQHRLEGLNLLVRQAEGQI